MAAGRSNNPATTPYQQSAQLSVLHLFGSWGTGREPTYVHNEDDRLVFLFSLNTIVCSGKFVHDTHLTRCDVSRQQIKGTRASCAHPLASARGTQAPCPGYYVFQALRVGATQHPGNPRRTKHPLLAYLPQQTFPTCWPPRLKPQSAERETRATSMYVCTVLAGLHF